MGIRKISFEKENRSVKEDRFIKGSGISEASKQISLKLPVSLLTAIDNRATELSISRAALIKQSCARFLESE